MDEKIKKVEEKMQQILLDYENKKLAEEKTKQEEEKQKEVNLKKKQLIKWGLYTKVYHDKFNKDYQYDTEKKKYYEQVADEISDEDYERLKSLNDKIIEKAYERRSKSNITFDKIMDKSNITSDVFKTIAYIIFLCSFVIGCMVGIIGNSFMLFLATCVSGFITGMLFLAISEVIRLLQELVDKDKEKNKNSFKS